MQQGFLAPLRKALTPNICLRTNRAARNFVIRPRARPHAAAFLLHCNLTRKLFLQRD